MFSPRTRSGEPIMPAQTSNLFRIQEVEDAKLRSVADWIGTFVAQAHPDLGRAGPVCPFVPGACERETLWLAPERIADRSVSDGPAHERLQETAPARPTGRGRPHQLQSDRR